MNNHHVASHPEILDRFIKIAKDCQTSDEFIKRTRQLEATPLEMKVFKQRYYHLDMFDSAKQFMKDVENNLI